VHHPRIPAATDICTDFHLPQIVAVGKKVALTSLAVVVAGSALVAAPPAFAATALSAAALEGQQQQIDQQKSMQYNTIEQQYNASKAKVASE
jgi:hypothetical protein